MPQFGEPSSFSVDTKYTGRRAVRCPVCDHDKFLDSGPGDEATRRRGFEHVVMGLSGKTKLLSQPVRFKFCENCGFILQFLIASRGGDHRDV